jgi:hypothetical protein
MSGACHTEEAVECCEGYFYNGEHCVSPTPELQADRSISMEGPTAVKDAVDTLLMTGRAGG